jgi:8-hydroxy-5-deazaflavin:NADPH oxidoreductase
VPMFGDLQADMFFCGDDTQAREVVAQLIADLAFRPMYVGDLSSAPMVEMLARLWGSLAYGQKMGRRLAFRMLTAEDET